MTKASEQKLRCGWTTGACATAATKAALDALWSDRFDARVSITLPRGEQPCFSIAHKAKGDDWAEVGIIKDAGDDPDVTHGALIIARVRESVSGIQFVAGQGVGTISKPGLPLPVGEAAINPAPREMMRQIVQEQAQRYGRAGNVEITIAIPNGEELATKTWNGRLGIVGGLSVLGTTGIVRPFSCAAWIASIHRGIDVARACGLRHVAGCTGATSESAVQKHYQLNTQAMLDMGDFLGGLVKYLRKHPIERLTIGGGVAKMTKLAQGAVDLHSARTQVDFELLSKWSCDAGLPVLKDVNTVLEAVERAGESLPHVIADQALLQLRKQIGDAPIIADVIVVDRSGQIMAQAQ